MEETIVPIDALEYAADRGRLAPSVHNTQPWTFVVAPDRLELRADRSRQLSVLDPLGRELVLSAGAALLNVRAALAARGLAAEVARLPRSDDPDLLAVVRVVPGDPEVALTPLDRVAHLRHTNRRPFDPATVSDDLLEHLVRIAAGEHTLLVPVAEPADRALVAELTQEADRRQEDNPAYRAELSTWTSRSPAQGDGVAASAVPLAIGARTDAVPIRDFDVRGTGGLPARTGSGTEQSMVVLATLEDDRLSWLRAGEALERVWLELVRAGWATGPITQALEVPDVRDRLRELTYPGHPQMLLRIGRAAAAEQSPLRPRRTVVQGPGPAPDRADPGRVDRLLGPSPEPPRSGPVPDGRGGTTWR
jgi:nitroreductase